MGKIREKIRFCFQRLQKKYPVEFRTLAEFSLILTFMLIVMLLEFAVNYWVKNNLTFINPVTQALPTYLALASLVLLIGGKAGKIYAGFMLSLLILANLVGTLVLCKFKIEFGADLFWVMVTSSKEESLEFFGSYFGWWRVGCSVVGFLAAAALLCWGIGKLKLKATRWTRAAGVLLLLPFIVCSIRYAIIWPGKMFTRTCMTRVFAGLYEFTTEWGSLLQFSRNPKLPEGLAVTSTRKPLLGVIVIGESAMRSHHGVYGYCRQTTPELAKCKDLIVYDDIISAWGSTTYALRLMMTQSTLDAPNDSRCSIVDVFRAGGFNVAMYSNQFRWGIHDGPIHLIFHASSPIVYLQELKRQAFDWELLPLLEPYWQQQDARPQIIFVHLIGSHHDAVGRYPADWGPFNGWSDAATVGASPESARLINEYDNSIAYTDHLLGEIARKIRQEERPAFLLYLSDHGDIIDNKYTALRSSGNDNPLVYEIPMVLLLNDSYRKAFPGFYEHAFRNRHQPLQTDRMFWSFADLAGVRCDAEKSAEQSIFSPAYRPNLNRRVSRGQKPYRPSGKK